VTPPIGGHRNARSHSATRALSRQTKSARREPASLRVGERLALVLRSDDADFEAYPVRDGSPYGFGAGTTFTSGYAQFRSEGNWVGWDQWGESDRKDGDLQFALQLAP
jgi:hypothetical protein